MQVQIKFDTEKESLDDLKRLVSSLQDLINQRENSVVSQGRQAVSPQQIMPQPVQANPVSGNTSGGGRIMEYDPAVGDLLSKFASGK